MNFLLHLLLAADLLTGRQVPAGTQLHVRLTTAVGSYASKTGTPVQAVLIAPVAVRGETLLSAGAIVSGRIKSVKRVGWGIVHETASLGLDFTRLTRGEDGGVAISTRLLQVDNGRERVGKDGVIHAGRSTSSLCYRVSGYVRTALSWEIESALAMWFVKTLVVQVPEPEIYYRPGTELTLTLTRALPLNAYAESESEEAAPRLTPVERVNIDPLVEELPDRAYAPNNRPSDIVNVLFLGSREELSTAFDAAGWEQAQHRSFRTGIRNIRAVAEGRGYNRAPMSSLMVNNAAQDMSWEKGLNDSSKRHHIRLWKLPETWHGRELWVGAATQDVDFAFFRPGRKLTHMVDRNIDQERSKVVNDLIFTGCVEAVDWMDRPGVPHLAMNGTGDPMSTDARLALMRLNECVAPRLATETVDETPLPVHGGKMQRFVRREILSMRSDVLRTNVYYRVYEGSRWVIEATIRRHRRRSQPPYPAPVSSPAGLERADLTGRSEGLGVAAQ
jgi:hypothetical protein